MDKARGGPAGHLLALSPRIPDMHHLSQPHPRDTRQRLFDHMVRVS
jgi:hypothetical protein